MRACRADKNPYRHDRRADKNPYRHDRRADKNPYRHDRRADSQCRNFTLHWLFFILDKSFKKPKFPADKNVASLSLTVCVV